MKRVKLLSFLLSAVMVLSTPISVLATETMDADAIEAIVTDEIDTDEQEANVDDSSDVLEQEETEDIVAETENPDEDFIFEFPTGGLLPVEEHLIDDSEIDPENIIYTDDIDFEEEYSEYQASTWAKYSTDYFYNKLPNDSCKQWWVAMSKVCDSYLDGTASVNDEKTEFVSVSVPSTFSKMELVSMFRYSNPQYFFLYSGYWGGSSSIAIMIYPDFVGSGFNTAKNKFFSNVDSWLGQISGSSPEQKIMNAHNYLCNKVTYNYAGLSCSNDAQWTQSAYSAFTINTTVCAGYSMSMTLLGNALGVPTIGITGTAGGAHAWNEVFVNNNWYNLDATWDDASNGFYYSYFVVSDKLYTDHHADADFETLRPKCTSTANDTRTNKYSDPGPLFKNGGSSSNHTHQMIYQAEIAATCGRDGMKAYYMCNTCGKLFADAKGNTPVSATDLTIPKNESLHDWVKTTSTKRYDCTQEASESYRCSKCQKTKTEKLPVKEHNWVRREGSTVTNCASAHYEYYDCTDCRRTKSEKVPGKEHNWVFDDSKPKGHCDEDHYDYYKCTVCIQTKQNWVKAGSHAYDGGTQITAPGDKTEGVMSYKCMRCGYEKQEKIMPLNPFDLTPAEQESVKKLNEKWFNKGDKAYWYEGGIRQGTVWDKNGVFGDGTNRGREICDMGTTAWYWLDAKYDGAKALNKEVWMPYIYQQEATWSDAEKWQNAQASGNMAYQVYNAICLHGQPGAGKWVRYDAYGRMYKGWYTVAGEQAFIYPDQIGNTYYYDEKTGLMAKGWLEIDGEWYYFNETTGVLQ